MSKIRLLLILFKVNLIVLCVYSQNNINLIPDIPIVSLQDRFGNLNAGKVDMNSGDYQKNFNLFSIDNKSLKYSFDLLYNSNGGLLVNEWGSSLGIKWNNNFESKITRQVYGLPDELGLNNKRNFSKSLMSEYSDENLSRVRSITANYDRTGQAVDGEYDIYSVSLNDISLSFIMHNDTGHILNYSESYSILRLKNNIYDFCITDNNGVKYFFGGDIKQTFREVDSGNGTIYFQPITVAWYLRKIEGVNGESINFHYSPTTYRELKSISQSANMTLFTDILRGYVIPEYEYNLVNSILEYNLPNLNSVIYDYNSYVLDKIETNNNITIRFVNEAREDLPGSFLIKEIIISYKNSNYKTFMLFYDKKISQNYQQEIQYFNNMDYLSDNEERYGNRIRYFLSQIKEISTEGGSKDMYIFEYKNLDDIPPRFSFKQDLLGYPMSRNSVSMFPKSALKVFFDSYSYFNLNNYYPLQDRTTDTAANTNGLLTNITYDTKSKESIYYENNRYFREDFEMERSNIRVSTDSYNSPTEFWDTSTFYHQGGALDISIDLQYKLLNLPSPESRDLFFINLGLYDIDKDIFLDLPYHYFNIGEIGFIDNSPVFDKKYLYVDLAKPFVQFKCKEDKPIPPGNYQVVVDLYNNNIYAHIDISYISSKIHKNEHYFYGVRTKEVKFYDQEKLKISKKYNYNKLDKIGENVYRFSDKSSLVGNFDFDREVDNFMPIYPSYTMFLAFSPILKTYSDLEPFPYYYRSLIQNSINDEAVYSGRHYKYQQVSEIINDTSITAYSYNIQKSTMANTLFGAIRSCFFNRVYQPNWIDGKVSEELKGYKDDLNLIVRESNIYEYSDSLIRKFENFYSQIAESEIGIYGSLQASVTNRFLHKLDLYNLYNYSYNIKWNNYTKKITTFYYVNDSSISLYNTLNYNKQTGLLKNEDFILSSGKKISKKYFRPYDFLSNPKYYKMSSINMISPIIEESNILDDLSVLNRKVISYKEFFDNRFTIDSIMNFNKLLEKDIVIFNSHDSYGNPREVKKQDLPSTVYLWGYTGQYPVLKIENATYGEVLTVLGQAVIDNLNSSTLSETAMESAINAAANNLRTDVRLSKSMVSSYTYKPLVGMTSETDARGVKTEYKYDGFQRLKEILDFEGNYLKNYQYNYRP